MQAFAARNTTQTGTDWKTGILADLLMPIISVIATSQKHLVNTRANCCLSMPESLSAAQNLALPLIYMYSNSRSTWPKLPIPRIQSEPSGLLQTVISAGSRSQGCAATPSAGDHWPSTGMEVSSGEEEDTVLFEP